MQLAGQSSTMGKVSENHNIFELLPRFFDPSEVRSSVMPTRMSCVVDAYICYALSTWLLTCIPFYPWTEFRHRWPYFGLLPETWPSPAHGWGMFGNGQGLKGVHMNRAITIFSFLYHICWKRDNKSKCSWEYFGSNAWTHMKPLDFAVDHDSEMLVISKVSSDILFRAIGKPWCI